MKKQSFVALIALFVIFVVFSAVAPTIAIFLDSSGSPIFVDVTPAQAFICDSIGHGSGDSSTIASVYQPTGYIFERPSGSHGYIVAPGDSLGGLWQIAYARPKLWRELLLSNPQLIDPDLIMPGQDLNIPPDLAGLITAQQADRQRRLVQAQLMLSQAFSISQPETVWLAETNAKTASTPWLLIGFIALLIFIIALVVYHLRFARLTNGIAETMAKLEAHMKSVSEAKESGDSPCAKENIHTWITNNKRMLQLRRVEIIEPNLFRCSPMACAQPPIIVDARPFPFMNLEIEGNVLQARIGNTIYKFGHIHSDDEPMPNQVDDDEMRSSPGDFRRLVKLAGIQHELEGKAQDDDPGE